MDKSDLIFLKACSRVLSEDKFNELAEELTDQARRELMTQGLILQLLQKRLFDLKEEVALYHSLGEELQRRIEERDIKTQGLK